MFVKENPKNFKLVIHDTCTAFLDTRDCMVLNLDKNGRILDINENYDVICKTKKIYDEDYDEDLYILELNLFPKDNYTEENLCLVVRVEFDEKFSVVHHYRDNFMQKNA